MTGALVPLTAVRVLANSGFRFLVPFLPVVARGLGVSVSRAALLASTLALAGVAAPAARRGLAGPGERPRRLLLRSCVALAVGAFAVGATDLFVVALVGMAIYGLAKPTYDIAGVAYLADRTPYARRGRTLGIFELAWSGALLLGAPAAGWLIARSSWRAPFLVLGGMLLVGTVVLARVVEHDAGRVDAGGDDVPRLGAGELQFLGAALAFSFGVETTAVVFGVWLERDFGVGVQGLGSLAVALGVAEIVGAGVVIAFADRLGKLRTAIAGLAISVAAFAPLPAVAELGPAVALFAAGLLGFEIAIVAAIPVASELWPTARTRFFSYLVAVVGLGRAAAAAVGPRLFETSGLAATVAATVAADVAAAGLLVAVLWGLVRREPGGARSWRR